MMPRSTPCFGIGRCAGLSLICAMIWLPFVSIVAAEPAQTNRNMVAAANPWAVDAGVDILRAGGSAVDAAIAVQLVLSLVESQSSGGWRRCLPGSLRRRHPPGNCL